MRRFGVVGLIGMAGLLAVATPAAAQSMSEGHTFLKAVKDRDGTKVTDALNRPGSVVVNARDISTGEGALHFVAQRRDETWLRFLLSKGANANVTDRRGITPLQTAINLGWGEGVEILVDAGAAIDTTNAAGETPLISAVHRRDAELVRMLVKAGANPERSDNSGRSARDYATLLGAQSPVLAALNEARDAKRAAKTYGPGV